MRIKLDMFEDNDDVQNVWHNWEDAEKSDFKPFCRQLILRRDQHEIYRYG